MKRKISILLLLYLLIMIQLILFKNLNIYEIVELFKSGSIEAKQNIEMSMNLQLFSSVNRYINVYDTNRGLFMYNIVGNILIFVPFGYLVNLLFKGKVNTTIFIGVVLCLLFEVAQLYLHIGIFDVDDIMLNTIGTIIGAMLASASYSVYKVFRTAKA